MPKHFLSTPQERAKGRIEKNKALCWVMESTRYSSILWILVVCVTCFVSHAAHRMLDFLIKNEICCWIVRWVSRFGEIDSKFRFHFATIKKNYLNFCSCQSNFCALRFSSCSQYCRSTLLKLLFGAPRYPNLELDDCIPYNMEWNPTKFHKQSQMSTQEITNRIIITIASPGSY